MLHALADPTRRRIVEQLGRGPASVSELAGPLPMSLPAVHQHLQVLEASGLVRSAEGRPGAHLPARREAPRHRRRLDRRPPATWERRLDRLGDFLPSAERHTDPTNPDPPTKEKDT